MKNSFNLRPQLFFTIALLVNLFAIFSLVLSSCTKEESIDPANNASAVANNKSAVTEASKNSYMPAYYDGQLFTINFQELPANAEASLLVHNHSINVIYMRDDLLPNGQMFISVLDAIQGDGFNPLWQEVQIQFNPGFTAHQFFSDTEIENAASGNNPEITLIPTDEVYRCSVVGGTH